LTWNISADDVPTLAWGAAVLGSGGGGSMEPFCTLVVRALREHPPVKIVDLAETDPSDLVLAVGLVGSVVAFNEKPGNGYEFTEAFNRLRSALPADATAHVCAYQAAGVNALAPLLVAAQTDARLVDCDGMGRAMHRLDQTTWAVAGVDITPFTLTESHNRTALLQSMPAAVAVPYIRQLMVLMGGWSAFAGYPQRVDRATGTSVAGSLSRAFQLGLALPGLLADRNAERLDMAGETITRLGGGRVLQVHSSPAPDGVRCSVVVERDNHSRRALRIEGRNEFLLVLREGEVVAEAPDIICLVDRRTSVPLLAERLRPGDDVDVLRLEAPARWKDAGFATAATPAALGLDQE
jgi:DUF917 family protein